jgi:hypothetical protein
MVEGCSPSLLLLGPRSVSAATTTVLLERWTQPYMEAVFLWAAGRKLMERLSGQRRFSDPPSWTRKDALFENGWRVDETCGTSGDMN